MSSGNTIKVSEAGGDLQLALQMASVRQPNVTVLVDQTTKVDSDAGVFAQSISGLTIQGMGDQWWDADEFGDTYPGTRAGIVWSDPSRMANFMTFIDCNRLRLRDLPLNLFNSDQRDVVGVGLAGCHGAEFRNVTIRRSGRAGVAVSLLGCLRVKFDHIETRGWDTGVTFRKHQGIRSNACSFHHSRLESGKKGIHVLEDGASSLSTHGCTIEGMEEWGVLIEEENCNYFDFGSHFENKEGGHVRYLRGGPFGNSRFNASGGA